MPARSLKNQPHDVYIRSALRCRVEEHARQVRVADDVLGDEVVPRRPRRGAGRGTRRGPPTGRGAARRRAGPSPRCPSRAAGRGPLGAEPARPGSNPPRRRCWQPQSVLPAPDAVGAGPGAGPHPGLVRRRPLVEQVDQSRAWRCPQRGRRRSGRGRRRARRPCGGDRTSRRRWLRPPALRQGRAWARAAATMSCARRASEGQRVGESAVVDDEVDAELGLCRVAPAERAGRVERLGVGGPELDRPQALVRAPCRAPSQAVVVRPEGANRLDLARGEDGEADALLGEDGEHARR